MILPYLATALLILVTVYSAAISFRERPEGSSPSWIFPNSAKRSARIFVVLSTLAVVIGFVVWVSMSARNSTQRSLRVLIPESYAGWVRVEFEIQGASALPVEGGQTVLKIPPSGVLKTSSPEQYGWAKDYYFAYSGVGMHPLPRSGPGRMIWGKINGEESGTSGKRKYEEFFVGTEQQYRDQTKVVDGKALR
ncbi:MAG: hypothetical protein WB660_31435 [Candidatus Sulfotelmatobacter sp.]